MFPFPGTTTRSTDQRSGAPFVAVQMVMEIDRLAVAEPDQKSDTLVVTGNYSFERRMLATFPEQKAALQNE